MISNKLRIYFGYLENGDCKKYPLCNTLVTGDESKEVFINFLIFRMLLENSTKRFDLHYVGGTDTVWDDNNNSKKSLTNITTYDSYFDIDVESISRGDKACHVVIINSNVLSTIVSELIEKDMAKFKNVQFYVVLHHGAIPNPELFDLYVSLGGSASVYDYINGPPSSKKCSVSKDYYSPCKTDSVSIPFYPNTYLKKVVKLFEEWRDE